MRSCKLIVPLKNTIVTATASITPLVETRKLHMLLKCIINTVYCTSKC